MQQEQYSIVYNIRYLINQLLWGEKEYVKELHNEGKQFHSLVCLISCYIIHNTHLILSNLSQVFNYFFTQLQSIENHIYVLLPKLGILVLFVMAGSLVCIWSVAPTTKLLPLHHSRFAQYFLVAYTTPPVECLRS